MKWALAVCTAVVLAFGALFMLLMAGTSPQEERGAAACGAAPGVVVGSGQITWPMAESSYRLSSGYGPRGGEFHRGIDLAAPTGTPIYAAHDAVVREAGTASGFGLWVVLDGTAEDGSRFSTVYGHNDRNLVTAGQQVRAGAKIAEVGNRGQSTGPHLHFEVWPGGRLDGGESIDPVGWLTGANTVYGGGDQADVEPEPEVREDIEDFADEVVVTGPFAPEGRQLTMAITPDRQANIDTIVGVVKGQQQPLRVAVIAVATAMQESSLRVIDYGDLAGPDSRGLFQQRAPWGPYEARMDPVQSTLYFLNGGAGGQRGLLSHDWRSQSLEDVVVATQISVGGYAKWEAQAMQLVAIAAGVDPIEAGMGAIPSPCAA